MLDPVKTTTHNITHAPTCWTGKTRQIGSPEEHIVIQRSGEAKRRYKKSNFSSQDYRSKTEYAGSYAIPDLYFHSNSLGFLAWEGVMMGPLASSAVRVERFAYEGVMSGPLGRTAVRLERFSVCTLSVLIELSLSCMCVLRYVLSRLTGVRERRVSFFETAATCLMDACRVKASLAPFSIGVSLSIVPEGADPRRPTRCRRGPSAWSYPLRLFSLLPVAT